jgi:ParB-like nuclease domain
MSDRFDKHNEADASLRGQLKAKGRRRRKSAGGLAAPAATPRALRNDLLPMLEIVYVPLSELRPATRKLRKLDPAHVREVATTISALGFCVPVLVGKDNGLIHGEVRLEAGRLLGLDRIPCVRIEHLSPNEQRLLRLAVNRLAEKGEWNLDELKIEFQELILADAPIEIAGFGLDEIDQILIGEEAEGLEQGPLAPAPGAVPIARLGDLFQLGPHRILCADATDPAGLARLMAGDPPCPAHPD